MILTSVMALATWSFSPDDCDRSSIRRLTPQEVSSVYGLKASASDDKVEVSGGRVTLTGTVYGASGCPAIVTSASFAKADGDGGLAFFAEATLDKEALSGVLEKGIGFGSCPSGKTSRARFSRGLFRSDRDLSPSGEGSEAVSAFSGDLQFSSGDGCFSLVTADLRGVGSSGLYGAVTSMDSVLADFRSAPERESYAAFSGIPSFLVRGISIFSSSGNVALSASSISHDRTPSGSSLSVVNGTMIPSAVLPRSAAAKIFPDPDAPTRFGMNAGIEFDEGEGGILFSVSAENFLEFDFSGNFKASDLTKEALLSSEILGADLEIRDLGAIDAYERYSGSSVSSILDRVPDLVPGQVVEGVRSWAESLKGAVSSVSIRPESPVSVPRALLAMQFSPASLSEVFGLSHENHPVSE